MRKTSYLLSDYISNKLQIKNNAPSVVVYVRQRYWDRRDLWTDIVEIDDNQEWYQLQNRGLSVEVQESTEQFASSFTVTFANEEGDLTPDNYTGKWPKDILFRGHGKIIYAQQLFPNNEVKIYLGYGDELVPFIHGYIGDTKTSADKQTIAISCMTSYKQMIHQTVKHDELKAPDGNLYDVLKFFFEDAGVKLHGKKMYVPGTGEEWIIRGAKGKRGQSYDEIVRQLIDTTFHWIKANPDGSCTLMPKPRYKRDDKADVVFEEGVNLTALDYNTTDQDVYSTATIKSGEFVNTFTSNFILNHVSLGKFKEEVLDVPWADSYFKRREVAMSRHLHNLHKWKSTNVGIIGDPRLELWDKVGIIERVSTAKSIYHIKSIQTMISDSGFVQALELSLNVGYEPSATPDLSSIVVHVPTIRLKLWDWDREDGDEVNIYCNGEEIVRGYKILNNPTHIDIDLQIGNNEIIFEGHRNPLGVLTGRLQVMTTSDEILFDVGDLPDLTFPRVNQDKNGYYTKKPAKTWIVSRLN